MKQDLCEVEVNDYLTLLASFVFRTFHPTKLHMPTQLFINVIFL
jgi:hypothetical protein